MRSLTFTLFQQTGDDAVAPATVTITENGLGGLDFLISNNLDDDSMIGDIRAIFFDVKDDALIGTLTAEGTYVTEIQQTGSVSNLGNGATSSGVPDSPYEIGVEIGTAGAAQDDLQQASFTLSSDARDLTLDDVSLENFTVRQTSVGVEGGSRDGSDKLWGTSPYPVNAIDDVLSGLEDLQNGINLFANDIDEDAGDSDQDGSPDNLMITAVNGDTAFVGEQQILADGIYFTLAADGSLNLDAEQADYLSEGEILTFTTTYSVSDGHGGSDTAVVTMTVTGVNDAPIAGNDSNQTDENTVVSGNVLLNDSDIDRLDTISVTGISEGTPVELASGALITFYADGSYDYDPNGAYDYLNEGESATEVITYQIIDDHGATATAELVIDIAGISQNNEGPGDGPDDEQQDHFGVFLNKKGNAEQAISNVVLYLHNDDGFLKLKIDGWDSGESDLDNVDVASYLTENYADYEWLAASIKVGNNHNRDLGPGEGQLFLLDGDEGIDYVRGGDVPEPLTLDVLSAHADITVQYSADLF